MAGNAYRDIFGYSPAFVIVEYVVTEAVAANLLDTDEGITAVGCPKCIKPLVQMHQSEPNLWCKCTKTHQTFGANAPKCTNDAPKNAPKQENDNLIVSTLALRWMLSLRIGYNRKRGQPPKNTQNCDIFEG